MMQRVSIPAEHCLSRRAASFSEAGINRRARIIENMRIMWATHLSVQHIGENAATSVFIAFPKTRAKLFVTLMGFVALCTKNCTMRDEV